jgi:exosome complex RNA-binding protein Csl4
MTLRLAFGLLIGILLALSVTSRADFGPGVWDQLQNRGDIIVLAKITKLEISPSQVSVGYREIVKGKKDKAGLKTATLCREQSTLSYANVEHHQRIESLRDAYRSGEIVKLSMTGPWSPCLSSITLSK